MNFFAAVVQIFSTRCVVILLGILSSVVTMRLLGPTNAGVVALMLLIRGVGFRFFNFGIPSALAYYAARDFYTTRRLVFFGICFSCALGLLAGGSIYCVREIDVSPWKGMKNVYFIIGIVLLIIYYIENCFSRILISRLKITQVNIAEMANPVLMTCLVVLFWALKFNSVHSVVLAYLFSGFLLVSYYVLLTIFSKDTQIKSQQEVKHGFSFFVHYCFWNYWISLLQYVTNEMGAFFIGRYHDPKLMGYYSNAFNYISKTESLSVPLSQMLFPFNARNTDEEGDRRTAQLVRILFPILILLSLVSFVMIYPAVLLLYGRPFLPTAYFFRALSPCIVSAPLAKVLATHFIAQGRPIIPGIGNTIAVAVALPICAMVFPEHFSSSYILVVLSLASWLQMLILGECFRRNCHIGLAEMWIPQKNDIVLVWNKIQQLGNTIWEKIQNRRKHS